MPERQFQLDLARATGIALVTAYHLWRFFDAPALPVGPFDLAGPAAMGFTGVDLFFVVSGYAVSLTWARGGGRTGLFLVARFLRIYPPYLVAIGAWCAVIALGHAVRPAGPLDVLTHLTFTHTLQGNTFFSISGVLWSLAVEAHFYLAFPLLALLGWRGLGALCAMSLAFTAVAVAVLPRGPAAYVAGWNLVTFLPLFLLGMALQRHACRLAWAGTAALILAALLMMTLPRAIDIASGGVQLPQRLVIGALLGFGLLTAAPRCRPASRVATAVAAVAAAAYSIYLYNYAFYLLPRPAFSAAVGFPLYFVLVVAVGMTMWVLVERPSEAARRAIMDALRRRASRPAAADHGRIACAARQTAAAVDATMPAPVTVSTAMRRSRRQPR